MSSAADTFAPIPARAPPEAISGVLPWLKHNLFDGWRNTLATLVILAMLALYVPPLIEWAVWHAVARPDNAACRAAVGVGACWGVVAEKYRLILFGRFPYAEQWRPLVACLMMIVLIVASCYRPFWRRALIAAWAIVLAAFFLLMHGGALGLSVVETAQWGGFPLTLMLATLSAGDGDSRCRSW